MNVVGILTIEKHFPKLTKRKEFGYCLFTKLQTIIIAHEFSPSSFKLKKRTLPSLTKEIN